MLTHQRLEITFHSHSLAPNASSLLSSNFDDTSHFPSAIILPTTCEHDIAYLATTNPIVSILKSSMGSATLTPLAAGQCSDQLLQESVDIGVQQACIQGES